MVTFRANIVVIAIIGNHLVLSNFVPRNTTHKKSSIDKEKSDTNKWKLDLQKVETRRQMIMKSRSTSSSSGEKRTNNKLVKRNSDSATRLPDILRTFLTPLDHHEYDLRLPENSEDTGSSLGIQSELSSSSRMIKYSPKSTVERHGWRKWHRKCNPCPEDMKKKWRDPSIRWICGGYQRARRTFKSSCMMYYRNCQDGTMFVKIHNQRCKNDTRGDIPHGDHFFYDYKVVMSLDSSSVDDSSVPTSFHSSDSDSNE